MGPAARRAVVLGAAALLATAAWRAVAPDRPDGGAARAATSDRRGADATVAPAPSPPAREPAADPARLRGRVRFPSPGAAPSGLLVLAPTGARFACDDGAVDVRATAEIVTAASTAGPDAWRFLVDGDASRAIRPSAVEVALSSPLEARVDVALPDGVFAVGRVRPPDGESGAPRLRLAPGVVEAGDEEADDPYTFVDPVSVPVAADGRAGPTFVARSPTYEAIAAAGGGFVHVRHTPVTPLAPGAALDLGTLDVPPPTGLRIRLVGVEGANPFALDVTRVRGDDPSADVAARALRALDPALAEALFGDRRLPLAPGAPLLLAPLPNDAAVRLTAIAPTGVRTDAVEVPLVPREIREVTIDVAATLSPADATGVTWSGRLLWSDTETPIVGARVAERRSRLDARTDADGRFRIGPLAPARELRFRITDLEAENPDRVERRRSRIDALGGGTEVVWRLERTRWLAATGLVPPAGHDVPIAFALELRDPGGEWRRAAADVFRETGAGVEISILETDVAARAVALWSPVLRQETLPVAVLAETRRVTTPFDALRPPVLVAGRVVGPGGAPAAGVVIEATGPIGGLPPLLVHADAAGRFTVGPTNIAELTLVCVTDAGVAEATVETSRREEVELVLE